MGERISHLPAEVVVVGTTRRQVCSWCGTLLEETDLLRAGAIDGDGEPMAPPSYDTKWGRFEGGAPPHHFSYVLLGDDPPEDACCRTATPREGVDP